MKRCSCCRKLKDESAFGKASQYKDGLKYYCKDCIKALRNGAKVVDIRPKKPIKRLVTGGLKITIQNYAKANESKFNIYDTDTEMLFSTNDKKAFEAQLGTMLEAI